MVPSKEKHLTKLFGKGYIAMNCMSHQSPDITLYDVFLARCDPCDLAEKRAIGMEMRIGLAKARSTISVWANTLMGNNLEAGTAW
jgi:hypothetical protein